MCYMSLFLKSLYILGFILIVMEYKGQALCVDGGYGRGKNMKNLYQYFSETI